MHPLNDAVHAPYVPVRVARGALVVHRYTYAPPRCRTSQYHRTFVLFSSRCPSGMILLTPCSMVWGWRVSRAGPMLFYWPYLPYPYCCLGVFGLLGCITVYHSLSSSLALPTSFNNNNNKFIDETNIKYLSKKFPLWIFTE